MDSKNGEMLLVANSVKDLNFSGLMRIYEETNIKTGRREYPREDRFQQVLFAEQDFYRYLRECFFSVPGAFYAIWVRDGEYVSGARWEPYEDGVLLSALETAPNHRGKGYATALVRGVLNQLEGVVVYSHISLRNRESLQVHRKCGFRKLLDHARYLDGSVHSDSITMIFET